MLQRGALNSVRCEDWAALRGCSASAGCDMWEERLGNRGSLGSADLTFTRALATTPSDAEGMCVCGRSGMTRCATSTVSPSMQSPAEGLAVTSSPTYTYTPTLQSWALQHR